ncbi:MAG TPA: glycosyl hydrolase, partial [Planctomycetota bacterium]|nr:glycosyl hydrolase [Planctomycetota bacterium]
DPNDDQKIWLLGVQLFRSVDGGATFKNDGARGVHVDHHALWIDPDDSLHMLLGNDGGLARSYDGAANWDVYQNLPISQFYAVGVDRRKPYRIYGGLQDNGTWGFPSVGDSRRGIENRQFYRVNGGAGFYSLVDPEDPNIVYSESQFGNPSRFDLRTGQRTRIRPRSKKGEPPLRFNWSTPMAFSPHNTRTLMIGSQKLHRSRDRGNTFEDLSPDLTTNDALKIAGNVPHCTLTTISESPVRSGVIWVGTDDGHVQVTQDDGRHWRNVTTHFPEEVRGLWVSCVEASPHEPGMAIVSFTGYREDRFEPYLFVTDDYGGTWTALGFGLPNKPINVVRAHPKAKDLLLVGTEGGVFVSEDAGGQWARLGAAMPSVPVHDLILHPDTGDLIAGTHGRGIYILPLAPLVDLLPAARQTPVTLAPVQITPLVPAGFGRGWVGVKHWRGTNPASGALFPFFLLETPKEEELTLKVEDWTGASVAEIKVKAKVGYNEARWNLTRAGAGRGGARPVPAGTYRVHLSVAGESRSRTFEVSAEDLSTAPARALALDDLQPSDYR